MIKKIYFVLFSIFAYSVVQASFYEKTSSFGTEVGKKIMQHPCLFIATGTLVMNVLPYYYQRKAGQLIREVNRVSLEKENRIERQKLIKSANYYKSKFESIRDKVVFATKLLPMAHVAYWALTEQDRAVAVFPKAMLAIMAIYTILNHTSTSAKEESEAIEEAMAKHG